jgi:ribosomal-protein-alanine N-acetyltransferase
MIFQTPRLTIRKTGTSDADVDLFYRLWTNPEVMVFVGFPRGLKITREQVRQDIANADDSEYDRMLIVQLRNSDQPIGECKLGLPDDDAVSHTDIKLLPEFWRQGYGSEIKRGLIDYLFTYTDCKAVRATPNRNNVASQKMQEAAVGKRVGEGVYRFPEDKRDCTVDVAYSVYMVYREDWESG